MEIIDSYVVHLGEGSSIGVLAYKLEDDIIHIKRSPISGFNSWCYIWIKNQIRKEREFNNEEDKIRTIRVRPGICN